MQRIRITSISKSTTCSARIHSQSIANRARETEQKSRTTNVTSEAVRQHVRMGRPLVALLQTLQTIAMLQSMRIDITAAATVQRQCG